MPAMKNPVLPVLFGLLLSSTPLSAAAEDAGDETGPAVVGVMATHDHENNRHLFRITDHEPDSGWTTFRFINASPVDHFFLIWRYPDEGIAAADAAGEALLDHWHDNVAGSFEGFDEYLDGTISLEKFTDRLVNSVQNNAPWFLDPGAAPMGGPGFAAPGATATTTVFLEPGEYIVECYVRDENGVFHTMVGMLDHLTVSETETGASQPVATARVTISSAGGIEVEQAPAAGSQVIEVHFADQTVYPHFLGHNVQLARIRDRHDQEALDAIAEWMDWRHPEGLVNNAPAGARFVGGVMEMTAGASGYMHVDLQPGDYLWIAEVPNPAEHGMLKTFTITD